MLDDLSLAEWQRRREEEEAARRAAMFSVEVVTKKREEDAALLAQFTVKSSDGGREDEEEEASDVVARKRAKVMAKNQAKRAQESRWEAARVEQQAKIAKVINADKTVDEKLAEYKQSESYLARQESYTAYYAQKEKEEQAEANRQALIAKNEERSSLDMAKVNALVEAQQEAKKKTNWWQKGLDWIDNNQPLTAVAVGVGVGLAAVAIVLTGGLAAPAAIALAAGVAGGTAVLGTVGLNSYFERPLQTNILKNTGYAVGAAIITAGVGVSAIYLGTKLATIAGPVITSICAPNPNFCNQIGPAVDMVEQGALAIQFGVQTALGDPDAPITYIEWQMELNDGGVPGNLILDETAEQLAKLGNDVPELLATYGDDIIPLLLKYQDDAVDIIGAYGDEGIALLALYGDDAISLITTHGTPAVDLMLEHGDTAIDALQGKIVDVDNIEEFVTDIKNVFPDARVWSSANSGQVYFSNSSEQALNASQKLAEAEAKGEDITGIISEIAEGSTHGSGNRVVLGAYDPNGGYIGEAIENGGIFFNTGDKVWKNIEESGINDKFAVNEQFLRNQLESGVDRIDFIGEDIYTVINNPDKKISESFRALEIRWLLKNAEDYGYELQGNSWVLLQP